jgi:hypothetical protein
MIILENFITCIQTLCRATRFAQLKQLKQFRNCVSCHEILLVSRLFKVMFEVQKAGPMPKERQKGFVNI